MDHFASLLFYTNQECTLRDNSLYFFNNCFEYAIKTGGISMSSEENILSSNYQKYARNLEFKYSNPVTPAMLMNMHNLEGFI